jgi:hypothetical protein
MVENRPKGECGAIRCTYCGRDLIIELFESHGGRDFKYALLDIYTAQEA